jgi:hypothetical protein
VFALRSPVNLFREFPMALSKIKETTSTEGSTSSGPEPETESLGHVHRYESPEVVRLGEIADASHNEGPARESVASYWQR